MHRVTIQFQAQRSIKESRTDPDPDNILSLHHLIATHVHHDLSQLQLTTRQPPVHDFVLSLPRTSAIMSPNTEAPLSQQVVVRLLSLLLQLDADKIRDAGGLELLIQLTSLALAMARAELKGDQGKTPAASTDGHRGSKLTTRAYSDE